MSIAEQSEIFDDNELETEAETESDDSALKQILAPSNPTISETQAAAKKARRGNPLDVETRRTLEEYIEQKRLRKLYADDL